MKVIIAGSRTIKNPNIVKIAIQDSGFHITEVVSGDCTGADALGQRWAMENNIPVEIFKADWDRHGLAAGPIRNKDMAVYADALIVIWNGYSLGTKDMLKKARHYGLKVYEHQV